MKKTKTFQNRGSPNCSYWHGVNSMENLATKFSTKRQEKFLPLSEMKEETVFLPSIYFKGHVDCSFDNLAG